MAIKKYIVRYIKANVPVIRGVELDNMDHVYGDFTVSTIADHLLGSDDIIRIETVESFFDNVFLKEEECLDVLVLLDERKRFMKVYNLQQVYFDGNNLRNRNTDMIIRPNGEWSLDAPTNSTIGTSKQP